MTEINDILRLLNLWWQDKKISEKIAKPYKRHIFGKFKELINYRQMIIISGLRRVGKTTLMYQLIESLLEKTDSEKLIYFNFDKKTEEINKILDEYQEITNIDWKREKIFVFLDEIVKLDDWANKIKLIYDAFPNIKFIISSSGSIALEKEAIKNLAGRYFLINVLPLNFREFLELRGKKEIIKNPKLWEKEAKKEFESYLLRSFPETVEWSNAMQIKDYLRTTIIDKIIKDDLPDKFKHVNKELLLTLLRIFYTEPGTYLDYDNLSRDLKISKKTLLLHVFFLEFSYLIKRIRNFRISTRTSSRKLQRAYAKWWTLAYCYTENYDKIMENVVASSIDADYYWRKDGKEVDFLIVNEKFLPIEVKNREKLSNSDLANIDYLLRKFKIKEGIVLYNGNGEKIKMEGREISLVPLWKWLLEEK